MNFSLFIVGMEFCLFSSSFSSIIDYNIKKKKKKKVEFHPSSPLYHLLQQLTTITIDHFNFLLLQ
jgi:hypothetical protein